MENQGATSDQIVELRRMFFDKLEKEGCPVDGGFHSADIDRINSREKWLRLFIEHNDLDLKKALSQLWDTCVWRKNTGVNDLHDDSVRQDYLHEGFMFPRNRDINGKRLMIFRSKLYIRGSKDMDDVKKILLYWIERVMIREEDLDQITLFFDLKDSGLSNMDMEYTRYIINTFKYYYPYSLNYIIIFEMPWILNTTFKIIKTLLPAKAVERMKFVNSKTLYEFVDESNMLDIWGGSDNYTYKFVPEAEGSPSRVINNNNNNVMNHNGRKVHFAKLSPTESPMSDQHGSSFTMEKGNNMGDEMLRVVQDTLIFNKSGNDFTGTVEIINIDAKPITYKVKTTAPDKFRVRPSSGVLAPGSGTTVNVVLVHGCNLTTLAREKFLVMCMALGADKQTNSQDIAELWKNTPSHSHLVEQHKVKCLLPGVSPHMAEASFKNGNAFSTSSSPDGDRQISHLVQSVHELTDTVSRLEMRLRKNQTLLFLALLVIGFFCAATLYLVKGSIEGQGMEYCVRRDD